MGTLSTHVLDSSIGKPAAGVAITLIHAGETIGSGVTDADGRVSTIGPEKLAEGEYTLVFEVGAYFAAGGREAFYPRVLIAFDIADAEQHYHVPVLLSPFSYSTYRGS